MFTKPLLHLGIKNAMLLLQLDIDNSMSEHAERLGFKKGTKEYDENINMQLQMMEKEGLGILVH